jgi:hypothetical protein
VEKQTSNLGEIPRCILHVNCQTLESLNLSIRQENSRIGIAFGVKRTVVAAAASQTQSGKVLQILALE